MRIAYKQYHFLRSVSNNGNFISWTKNIHGSIMASIRGIFLKFHSCHYSRIAYAYKTPHFVIDHNNEHIILGKYFGFISIELSETQHQEF